ncbi:hypothetical protein ACSMXN_12720 [Jatrophihabitans sp. DSM 45814]
MSGRLTPTELINRTSCAVEAARTGTTAEFDEANRQLEALGPDRVVLVQAAVIRGLLEEIHPEGLTGEHVGQAIERCLTSLSARLLVVDAEALIAVYAGALGVADLEERAEHRPSVLITNASLVIADLCDAAGADVSQYLVAAIAEIERAETMELP